MGRGPVGWPGICGSLGYPWGRGPVGWPGISGSQNTRSWHWRILQGVARLPSLPLGVPRRPSRRVAGVSQIPGRVGSSIVPGYSEYPEYPSAGTGISFRGSTTTLATPRWISRRVADVSQIPGRAGSGIVPGYSEYPEYPTAVAPVYFLGLARLPKIPRPAQR